MLMTLFAVAGFFCGFLNTLASSGSAVTLPLLIFLGLSPEMANGTNRLPVLVGSMIAIYMFAKSGKIHWPIALKVVIPSVVGSFLGALLAETISAKSLGFIITIAMLIALVLLFTKTKHAFLKDFSEEPRFRWQEMLLFVVIGFWLGFIVLDGATYLMLALILAVRLPFVQATAIKNLAIASSTCIALIFFATHGHINWEYGIVMALGSIAGGAAGAKVAMFPWAKIWTYRILIFIILIELVHLVIKLYHNLSMQ
ncbi:MULTISPECIES: sulfite exporter TauE/SafE family protein [unclassified Legionella]|uniref:sulfite exporter TauE/SafE family protein n=1 Tax=unclassified Legionella TaxID=2622702 RepID=UPI001054F917|nr:MULTISPECIES: sulfite exporter TauE/SafE family protein [unclassified Legionella]MDI9818317.1 sulfite exporter TauE/SafE family protein [Legionella sp. PL877]